MYRKLIYSAIVGLVAAGMCQFSQTAAAEESRKEPVLLVVPSQYTIVQLAFDMSKLRRDVLIVCFSEKGVKTGQSLYVWDPNPVPGKWVQTTFENYTSGDVFGVKPGKVVIVGTEKDVPAVLADTSKWCKDVSRASTLNIMELMNSLNETFKFSQTEWKWLAKEYDLKLEDLNAMRRRYGRWGKPGEKQKVELPGVEVKKNTKKDDKVTPVAVPLTPVTIQNETPAAPKTDRKSAPEDK